MWRLKRNAWQATAHWNAHTQAMAQDFNRLKWKIAVKLCLLFGQRNNALCSGSSVKKYTLHMHTVITRRLKIENICQKMCFFLERAFVMWISSSALQPNVSSSGNGTHHQRGHCSWLGVYALAHELQTLSVKTHFALLLDRNQMATNSIQFRKRKLSHNKHDKRQNAKCLTSQ